MQCDSHELPLGYANVSEQGLWLATDDLEQASEEFAIVICVQKLGPLLHAREDVGSVAV